MDNQIKLDEIVKKLDEVIQHFAEVKDAHAAEHEWVKLAIQKEAQTIALRRAIIEKTLGGLVWAAIVGFGIIILSYFENHGWRR